MSTTFEIKGLEELREELRRLPEALRDEARDIITAESSAAMEQIVAAYPEHTGNLRNHVYVSTTAGGGRYGVAAVVRNTAKHAWIFENGTQTRQTAIGANRGAMAPGHVFIPIVIRHRRAMYARLADLLRTKGMQVSGVE
jgi:hypothetical protein